MKQGSVVILLVFLCVCANRCIQGTVWIEPNKSESMLYMEEGTSSVCVCVCVCRGGGGVYAVVSWSGPSVQKTWV